MAFLRCFGLWLVTFTLGRLVTSRYPGHLGVMTGGIRMMISLA